MLELNNDLSTLPNLKRDGLRRAFQIAYEQNHMSEDHYIKFVELLIALNPKQELIVQVNEMIPSKN